jgi:hypothetical protein
MNKMEMLGETRLLIADSAPTLFFLLLLAISVALLGSRRCGINLFVQVAHPPL